MMVKMAWYSFVVLIMLSAYTANLAATMSSERIPEVVKGVDQLKSKVASVFCGGAVEQYLIKQNLVGRIICKYSYSSASDAVRSTRHWRAQEIPFVQALVFGRLSSHSFKLLLSVDFHARERLPWSHQS